VVLVSANGSCEYLKAVGPPLGLLPGVSYPAQTAVLEPGTVLLAYTDGLSEAPAPGDDGPDFGLEGIVALALKGRAEPMERLVGELFAAVETHTGGAPPHDDRTVLAARRLAG
jgi:sigma-B regulation protein RsbU (phosphoserine phosphatase)